MRADLNFVACLANNQTMSYSLLGEIRAKRRVYFLVNNPSSQGGWRYPSSDLVFDVSAREEEEREHEREGTQGKSSQRDHDVEVMHTAR